MVQTLSDVLMELLQRNLFNVTNFVDDQMGHIC